MRRQLGYLWVRVRGCQSLELTLAPPVVPDKASSAFGRGKRPMTAAGSRWYRHRTRSAQRRQQPKFQVQCILTVLRTPRKMYGTLAALRGSENWIRLACTALARDQPFWAGTRYSVVTKAVGSATGNFPPFYNRIVFSSTAEKSLPGCQSGCIPSLSSDYIVRRLGKV